MMILVRADSSSAIGLGHIRRDMVLAERYRDDRVEFACRELPGHAIDLLEEAGFRVHRLKSDRPDELMALVNALKAELLIIDHYGIGKEQETSLKNGTGVRIMVLDDTYEAHECDILLNHNIGADSRRYRGLVPERCTLLCGSRYGLIGPEFRMIRRRPLPGSVLICMGGSDPSGLNMKVARFLERKGYRCIIATTSANPRLQRMLREASKYLRIEVVVDAPSLAVLMADAAFGVVTPSVLAQEAMAAKLPIVAVQSAENQKMIVNALRRRRIPVLSRWNPDRFDLLLKELHETRRFNIA